MSETSSGAVFLSYASQDAEAASRIAEALRTAGITVWFDQAELAGGDAWDKKIRDQIKSCALFLPLISANTQARSEGYFRLEWKLAAQRTHMMSERSAFLLPIVIDETPDAIADVPSEFKAVQWTRLRYESFGGQAPLQPNSPALVKFTQRVQSLLNGVTDSQPSISAVTPQQIQGPARPAKKVLSSFIIGVITAILISVGAAIWSSLSPKASETQSADVTLPTTSADNAVELDDKSIAVLPFANMSEDPENSAFFSDGVHEDILTNLARIRDFRVVSRTSVTAYRTTTKPMRQIAAELGVTYILEGSVRRAGDKVRVTGQLIRAATDEHVWAQSYDRDLTDVFAIQADLAQQIAAALQTALSPEEQVMISHRPTDNTAAYDLFLQARALDNREYYSPVTTATERIVLLQQAVDLDPNFAEAWAEIASAYARRVFILSDEMDDDLPQAKQAIDRAVQLAPDNPEVIAGLGSYFYNGYRDYARAAEQYDRLARMQPNSPIAYLYLGLVQRRQGHWVQSLANLRRAVELDPTNLNYLRNLRTTLIAARRWEDVLTTQRRIIALVPDDLLEAAQLGVNHFLATGSTAEADTFFAQLTPNRLNSPLMVTYGWVWAVTKGDWEEAVRLSELEPFKTFFSDSPGAAAKNQAFCLFYLGDRAGAKSTLGDFPDLLRGLLAKEPNNLDFMSTLADMEALLGNKDEALRLANGYVALMPESRDALSGMRFALDRAMVYDLVGEKEEALAEFTRLLHTPCAVDVPPNIHMMQRNTGSTLWDDPRYQALIHDPKNNEPLF